MKLRFTLFYTLLFVLVTHAQDFNVGIKVGAGSSQYTFDEILYVNVSTATVLQVRPVGSVFAYNVGTYGRYNLGNIPLGVRLGLQYTNAGGKVEVYEQANNTNIHINEHNHRIDIPLQLTYNLKSFRVLGGVSYVLDIGRSTEVVDYLTTNFVDTDRFNFTVGSAQQNYWTYHFGIGVEVDNWALDLLFENSMSEDLTGSSAEAHFNFGPNPRMFSINYTYFLFRDR